MNKNIRFIIIIAMLLLPLVYAVAQISNDTVSPAYLSQTSRAPTKTLNILFIGNSYIFVNNLPKMLVDMASSNRESRLQIKTQAVTLGGAHLAELLRTGTATNLIHSQHWDYVVLQEQSTWIKDEADIKDTFDAAARFAQDIRDSGAKPVLYLTWIRQPGSKWYQPPFVEYLKNPEYMQSQLDSYTFKLGENINAMVVPAGDAWTFILKNRPSLSLYQNDGSHPTPAGTYLVALMFYHFLTEENVEYVTYLPQGVTASEGSYLRSVAARTTKPAQ